MQSIFLGEAVRDLKTGIWLMISIFVGVFISFVPLGSISAQCIDYHDYQRWVRTVESSGTISQIVVDGSNAYIIDEEAGLQIFDITQPDHPVVVGGLDVPSLATGLAVSGQYVYYGQYQNYPFTRDLLIIDAADSQSPTIVSRLELAGTPKGIAISGTHAFVAASNAGLLVVDISDPLTPEIVGQMDSGAYYHEVTIRDNLAFVLNSDGLQILDISGPTDPQLIGNNDFDNNYRALVISEDYAYVTTDDALWVVDIINLEDPQEVSSLTFPFNDGHDDPGEMILQGQLLFVGTNQTGLQTVDISNPYEPTIVGGFHMPDRVKGMALHENHAYIGYLSDWSPGFKVVDISNPLNPEMLGRTGGVYSPKDMVIAGDLLCVASEYYGLKILDISNPQEPQIMGGVELPELALSLDISGTIAFVGEQDGVYHIVDISDPVNPEILGSRPIIGDAIEMIVQGEHLIISTSDGGDQGMVIYNISYPEYPWQQGSVYFSMEYPVDVRLDVEGDIVCATQDNKVFVVDISNPSSPVIAYTMVVPGGAGDVVMSGTRAFIAASGSQLMVLDISDPENPSIESSISLPSGGGELSISGQQIYVVNQSSGVHVVDISNPESPRFAGSLPRPYGQGFSASNEDHLFVTGWDHELAVFSAQCSAVSSIPFIPAGSSTPMLDANFPNPFNPQTSIGFRLPEAATVSLEVYDLAGRLIRSIVRDEAIREGFHSVVWDGRDTSGLPTASGVYFYRLDAGDYSETRRMVLIK